MISALGYRHEGLGVKVTEPNRDCVPDGNFRVIDGLGAGEYSETNKGRNRGSEKH